MKIGFVDYYISEWHANNYPRWIAQMCEQHGFDATVAYAWAEKDVSLVDGVDTDTWCKENGAQRCMSIDELCEKSDAIVVLAPSDPHKHLEYAKAVFKHKKPVYIDKTFAPDLKDASEIFNLAKEYGVKFFSSSALRYADELDAASGAVRICTTGGGSNLEEYIIHQIEMVVRTMGAGFNSVTYTKEETADVFELTMADGRSASVKYAEGLRFAFEATLENGEKVEAVAKSSYFKTLMTRILEFFTTQELPFDSAQTIEVMRIRDAILESAKNENSKIEF